MEQLTKEQIFKYKKELEYFYAQRKKFLIIALILFGIVLISIIGTIILAATSNLYIFTIIFIYPMVFCFIGGIILLILRSALYNVRINNRKIAIEYAELQDKEKE